MFVFGMGLLADTAWDTGGLLDLPGGDALRDAKDGVEFFRHCLTLV